MDKLYFIVALEIILMIFVEFIICYIIKIQGSLKLEDRISQYSITQKTKYNLPFFDSLTNKLTLIIKKISKILLKSEVLKKYSNKYIKYISYNEKDQKKPMDYISLKLLFSALIFLLYLITSLLKFDYMLGLLIFIVSFFIPDILFKILYKQKNKILEKDLLESVIIMNNAFKSGKNILEAIEIVKNEMTGPLKEEFQKIYIDLTHGLDIDVVFNRFYERVKIEDIKYMTSSLTLLNKTGGNIVKVFSSIETNFYDKKVLNQELESLTSSSKLMYKLLLFMPFILVAIIILLNPSYFHPLIETKIGIAILILATILYVGYIIVVRKIMRIKI